MYTVTWMCPNTMETEKTHFFSYRRAYDFAASLLAGGNIDVKVYN